MSTVVTLIGLVGVLIVANLAAQRLYPTLRSDDVGRKLVYRVVFAAVLLSGVGLMLLVGMAFGAFD